MGYLSGKAVVKRAIDRAFYFKFKTYQSIYWRFDLLEMDGS